MDIKKFLIGTLVGGLVFFFVGYLFYGVAFVSFFTEHSAGPGKPMEELVWWALILGNLSSAALLTYIFLKWTDVSSFGSGASAAAAIGFFMTLAMDMTRYATTNTLDLTGALADVVVGTVLTAVAGGAIGAVVAMGKKN